MRLTKKEIDDLSYHLIGAAIEVHKELGPGLLESVYQACYEAELNDRGLFYEAQKEVEVIYKGRKVDAKLRLDFVVEDCIVIELKAVETILNVHKAQLLTYMKLLEMPKGIIINFNCSNIFKEGQKTMVNEFYEMLL